MFNLFIILSYSNAPYDLIPPFKNTNVSEINEWSILGFGITMKDYIRLTSEATKKAYGVLCNRLPTTFTDWAAEIELKASKNGGAGGENFVFSFTDTVCQIEPMKFAGFAIYIKTGETDVDNLSPVYFYDGSVAQKEADAVVRIRNVEIPLKIKVIREGDKITFQTFNNRLNRYDTVFTKNVKGLFKYGYFTFSSKTDDNTDNNDFYKFKVTPLSEDNYKIDAKELSRKNRKLIDDDVELRRFGKAERRAMMATSIKYQNKASENKNRLNGEKSDLGDAFKIINEAIKRGESSVTLEQLKKFIFTFVKKQIQATSNKVNLALENFNDIQLSVEMLWSHLRSELSLLSVTSKEEMEKKGDENTNMAKTLNIGDFDDYSFELKRLKDKKITKALIIIMAIEVIAYLLFFIVKHRKTRGFKKID